MNTIRKQMLAAALSAAMLTIGDVVSSASNVYLSDESVAESLSASGVLTRVENEKKRVVNDVSGRISSQELGHAISTASLQYWNDEKEKERKGK